MQHGTKLHSRIARTLYLILALSAAVSAQTFRGTILGTVTDPNGAVVAGATITVKNTSTGLERSVTTDDAGNYSVPELPIGPYEVRVDQTGFVSSVVSNVTVEVASERCVDVTLNVVGDPYAGTSAPDRFINLSAFAVPCTLDPAGDGSAGSCISGTWHFGSLGRNALRGPSYHNVDFSIFKDTDITEKLRLQLRAEVFNIFNHPNFSNPLLPSFAADMTSSIDPVTGRGTGFLPITVTPDVGIGTLHGRWWSKKYSVSSKT